MDAYDLTHKLIDNWRSLVITESGAGLKKSIPAVPVYVEINDQLLLIDSIETIDNKIILKTK
jgi:hypothetical protein